MLEAYRGKVHEVFSRVVSHGRTLPCPRESLHLENLGNRVET